MTAYQQAVVPEIVRNALVMVTAEMKAVVARTAYSTTWSEAGDLSCAVLTSDGELVAQGERDIPVHLGTMPLSVRGCLDAMGDDIEPGDILLHNDPRIGNNHLPDFLAVRPVFVEDELVAHVAVRAHWADVGGRAPGSLTTVCTDAFQEGIRVPPVHLARADQLNEELIHLLLSNTRAPNLVHGDLRAQIAGLRRGEARVASIASKHGRDVFTASMHDVLDRSEALMRQRIAALPDGVYAFEDACDGDGLTDELAWVRVRLTIGGSNLTADFSASDGQSLGAINCPRAVSVSATYFAIKAFIDATSPVNSGSYRPVHRAHQARIANARRPGRPSGGRDRRDRQHRRRRRTRRAGSGGARPRDCGWIGLGDGSDLLRLAARHRRRRARVLRRASWQRVGSAGGG